MRAGSPPTRLPTSSSALFTTAFDEYLLEAVQINRTDYLLKPIRQVQVNAAIDKYHAPTAFTPLPMAQQRPATDS